MGLWKRWRAWLDRESFDKITVLPEVVEDICSLARGSHPRETIAFLTGNVEARTLMIDGLYVKGYDADETSASFTTHDLPLTGVYGTVHSHPGWTNRPSQADKKLFNKEGWFHLIICRPYTRGSIAAYNKYGEPIEVEL